MQRWQSRKWIYWLPLLLVLFSVDTLAAPLIKLSENFSEVALIEWSDLLFDPTTQLSVDEITRQPQLSNFSPAHRTPFKNINSKGAYWLRFGIENPQKDSKQLALNLRIPDEIDITAYSGALQPLQLQRTPLLQLNIPANSKQLFYLRIGPGATEITQLELLSLERYLTLYRIKAWVTGVLQSCLFLIATAALFLSVIRKSKIFLWLAGYCLASTIFQIFYRADVNPLTFEYLPDWKYRHTILQISLCLSFICIIEVAKLLPITRQKIIKSSNPLSFLIGMVILTMLLCFFIDPIAGSIGVILLSAFILITTIFVSLYSYLQEHRRELILFALLRAISLALTVAGALAWQFSNTLRTVTDSTLPFAMMLESLGLLAILIWQNFELQKKSARREREIATLEAEARSRTEIIAEVGHRVRTPISAVLGMLDMLQDTTMSATQTDYINTIRRAGNELLNTVNELSDVSRLQSHDSNLQQNIFDPHALIIECVDGFRSVAEQHQLELISDVSPVLASYVKADATRLRQIILQLLHYSIDHHEHGEIVIRANPFNLDQVQFEIHTTASILTKHNNENDRSAQSTEISNVRLDIARQLVEILSGQIQFSRIENNFSIKFQLSLPAVERNTPNVQQDTTLQNKRLLVIDDNETFCNVLVRQLHHWGMTVYVAYNLSEGIARLRNQLLLKSPVDVVLLDTDLPEFSQSEWAHRLYEEIAAIPILIFLSSSPKNHKLPALNPQHILLKPINHTSLRITLIEALKQKLLPKPARKNTIRCLFAEDNPINAEVLASMLERLGVEYVATKNGQEAVDACRRNEFDIVLMDCDMPVMDGWEASRNIRETFENRGTPAIPIIALTANSVEELGERARQFVMDAHLVKPIQLDQLRQILEQWTGKLVPALMRESR